MRLRLEDRSSQSGGKAQTEPNAPRPPPAPAPAQGSPTTKNAIISQCKGIAILSSLVVLFFVVYFIFRYIRKNYDEPPVWFPNFIKKRWKRWPSVPSGGSTAYSRARIDDGEESRAQGVDRTTSVRSVMTLPEYRAIANPDKERTIAREGERGGMDVVIEFPETHDEEEARREQHMQTLYEVRLARTIDREERRARREARRRGERLPSSSSVMSTASGRPRTASGTAPPQISGGGVSSLLNVEAGESPRSNSPAISSRVQDVLATRSATSLAALIAEPTGRLPQVGYAEIGIVRPDGSRARESSVGSDQRVLLNDAASMANSHSRHGSDSSITTVPYNHGHARSASALSITTYASAPLNTSTPSLPRTARRGSGDSFQYVQLHGHGRQSADLTDMRNMNPPEYDRLQFEEAPPYDSPITTRLEVPPLAQAETRRGYIGPSGDLTSPSTVRRNNVRGQYGDGGI